MGLGEKIASRRQRQARVIEAPEWWGDDDAPLLMYVFPITGGEYNKIQKKHKNFADEPTMDGVVDLIIMKACDADGNRLFTLEDRVHLMGEDLEVLSDIVSKMFSGVETIEDAEKN